MPSVLPLAVPLSLSGSVVGFLFVFFFNLICLVKDLGSRAWVSPVQRPRIHITEEAAKNDVKLGTSQLGPSWVWGIQIIPNSIISWTG